MSSEQVEWVTTKWERKFDPDGTGFWVSYTQDPPKILSDANFREYVNGLERRVAELAGTIERTREAEVRWRRIADDRPTVVCEDCAFRYGSEHTTAEGDYECPVCELQACQREKERLRAELTEPALMLLRYWMGFEFGPKPTDKDVYEAIHNLAALAELFEEAQ